MFKNETLVKWIVCSWIAIAGISAVGAESGETNALASLLTNSRGSATDCSRAYQGSIERAERELSEFAKKYRETHNRPVNREDPMYKDLLKDLAEVEARLKTCIELSSGSGNFCPAGAVTNFAKRVDEFAGACKNMPNISKEGASGNIACGYAVARCDCRFLAPGLKAYSQLECSNGPSPVSSGASNAGEYDLAAAEREFAFCPMVAASDIKEIEKQIREAQKELREAERRTPELEQAKAEIESQGREKVQQARQQQADAAKQWQQQRQDALRQQREAGKNIAAQVLQKQEAITRNDEARDGLTTNRQKAELERQAALSKLEDNCHQQALGQVEQTQAKRLLNANRGGFNKTLSYVGLTDRDEWQAMANEYHRRCMRSGITRNAIKNINRLYEQALKEANAGERNLDKRRTQLVNEMNQLQNAQGCSLGGTGMSESGVSTETQACQALRTAKEEMAKVDADYRIQHSLHRQAERNAESDMERRKASKQKEIDQAESIASQERSRLRNLMAYLDLKRRHAKGGSGDSKDASETMAKHGALVGSATSLAGCFSQQECEKNKTCRQAAAYLNLIGQDFKYGDDTSSPGPSGSSGTNVTPASAPLNGTRQDTGGAMRD